MIYQVIVEHDRVRMIVVARVYQGVHQVGHGTGRDGVSAVCDAFTELQRRNSAPIVTGQMRPVAEESL